MRRIRAVCVFGAVLALGGCEPGGRIRRQWAQPNEEFNNLQGVGFYHDFRLEGLKGKQCYVEVRLADRAGRPILSTDGRYQTPDTGQVSARRAVTCVRSQLEGKNLRVFVPYDQLELPPGEHRLVMETRLVSVHDQKVLDRRRRQVVVPVPTELARASRVSPASDEPNVAHAGTSAGMARPIASDQVARPVDQTQVAVRVAQPATVQQAAPVEPPKPPEPPKPRIFWFIKLRHDRTLRGPYDSRNAGEADLSQYAGTVVAKAPTDKVWLSTCFDLQRQSEAVRVIGPFDQRELAVKAQKVVRHQTTHAGWAFSDVAAIPVETFVNDFARRAR